MPVMLHVTTTLQMMTMYHTQQSALAILHVVRPALGHGNAADTLLNGAGSWPRAGRISWRIIVTSFSHDALPAESIFMAESMMLCH